MTAEALLMSLSNVTGVPVFYDETIGSEISRISNLKIIDLNYLGQTGYYGDVAGNLPIELTVDKFNSSNMNSIISLSGSFCEELFTGTDPRTETRYHESFFPPSESNEFTSDNFLEETQISYVDYLLNKFIPHVNIDEGGKNILLENLSFGINKVKKIIDNFGDYFVHTNSASSYISLTADNPTAESMIDLNQNFFISYFVMPNDPEAGIASETNVNIYPQINFKIQNDYLNIKHYYSGHELYATLSLVIGYVPYSFRFVINNSSKNNLKNEPYHIVLQYVDSGGTNVDINEDFNVYVNNELVIKTDIYGRALSGTFPKNNFKIINFSEEVSEGNFSAKSTLLSILTGSKLGIGGIEIYDGSYSDLLATELDNENYFDEYGVFKIPHSKDEILLKEPYYFMGKINDGAMLIYTKIGELTSSDGSITEAGLRQTGHNFRFFDFQIEWPNPYIIYGANLCTAILSSQYFLFN